VRYTGTFGINAWAYCQAMRDVLRDAGVTIHEKSCVTSVRDGSVSANGCTVTAGAIIACVDRSLPDLGMLKDAVYRIQTFLAVSRSLTDARISEIFPESRLMVWDSDLIYSYFRVTTDNRLLLGVSSALYTYSHRRRSIVPRILRTMRSFVKEKFPHTPVEFEYFWPGLIGVSKDLLPLAAKDPDRPTISYVSGATGLAWAAALGRYMAEKVQSNRFDLDAEFDPGRHFVVAPAIQSVIGKPASFALSHGVVKLRR
jgi:gamma-glutamylputrescine oxidase